MCKIKTALFAVAAVATAGIAGSASAQITASFTAGSSVPVGTTIYQNFDSCTTAASCGITKGTLGTDFVFHAATPNDALGAAPNASTTGSYLSVLGGGSATYTFTTGVTGVSFDWGTASSDNTLNITYDLFGNTYTYNVPNSNNPNGANYNKNGLFTAIATGGAVITKLQFTAGSNSFEVDNISAAAVPEPATWGMMILGFGMLGMALRRRKQASLSVA